MHKLHGLCRESSSPRGEFGCVGRCAELGEARVHEAMGLRQRTKLKLVDLIDELLVVELGGKASWEPAKR